MHAYKVSRRNIFSSLFLSSIGHTMTEFVWNGMLHCLFYGMHIHCWGGYLCSTKL